MKKLFLAIAFYGAWTALAQKAHTLSVTINYDKAVKTDTLTLILVHAYGSTRYDVAYQALMGEDRLFHFNVKASEDCGYFKIEKRETLARDNTSFKISEFVPLFFWESGDDLQLSVFRKPPPNYDGSGYENYTYRFKGKGSEKYIAKYTADSVYAHAKSLPPPDIDKEFKFTERNKPRKLAAVAELEKFKTRISPTAFNVAKTDLLFGNSSGMYNMTRIPLLQLLSQNDTAGMKKFQSAFFSYHPFAENESYGIPETDLGKSINFNAYTIRKFNMSAFVSTGKEFSETVYDSLKTKYRGGLRDALLVSFFLGGRASSNIDKLYADARATVKTPSLLAALQMHGVRMRGMKAFNFSFSDPTGKIVRLSDLKGKTVVMDFWYNGCGPCAGYYKNTLSKAEQYFADDNSVVFVTVSSDINKPKWLAGLSEGIYASASSLNLYTGGRGIEDPFMQYYSFTATPTALLIDKEMKIAQFNTVELFEENALIKAIKSIK